MPYICAVRQPVVPLGVVFDFSGAGCALGPGSHCGIAEVPVKIAALLNTGQQGKDVFSLIHARDNSAHMYRCSG